MDAVVTALGWLAAGLLVAAGAGKLAVPDGAMATLHALGVPSGRIAARALGLAELGVAVFVVAAGGRAGAGVLAVVYAALLAVLEARRRAQASCGCFGGPHGPVTWRHVALDGAAVVVGAVGLFAPPWSASAVVASAGVVGAAGAVLLVATGTVLLRSLATAGAGPSGLTAVPSAAGRTTG